MSMQITSIDKCTKPRNGLPLVYEELHSAQHGATCTPVVIATAPCIQTKRDLVSHFLVDCTLLQT